MRYTVLLMLLMFPPALAAETESEACKRLAPKYHTVAIDAVLPDESRVDLLSETHAWEVDWAPKWSEGVGQSLLYAIWTGKQPGLILLVKDRRAEKHFVLRAKLVCEKVGIDLRVEKSNGVDRQRTASDQHDRGDHAGRGCGDHQDHQPERTTEAADLDPVRYQDSVATGDSNAVTEVD